MTRHYNLPPGCLESDLGQERLRHSMRRVMQSAFARDQRDEERPGYRERQQQRLEVLRRFMPEVEK